MNCSPLMFVINRLSTDRIITSFFIHERHSCELDYNLRYKRRALWITSRLLAPHCSPIILCLLSWTSDSNHPSETEIYVKWVPHVRCLLQSGQSSDRSLQPMELCVLDCVQFNIKYHNLNIQSQKKRRVWKINHLSYHASVSSKFSGWLCQTRTYLFVLVC